MAAASCGDEGLVFAPGDRVRLADKGLGYVRYFGPRKELPELKAAVKLLGKAPEGKKVEKLAKLKLQIKQRRGLRVGVELDEPNGEHEGTLAGHMYFETKPKCASLVKPKKVELVMSAAMVAAEKKKSAEPAGFVVFELGDKVRTEERGDGVVLYAGEHHKKPGVFRIGMRLDQPLGKNNGTYEGFKYFECEPKHGYLCGPSRLKLVKRKAELEAEAAEMKKQMDELSRKKLEQEAEEARKAAKKAEKEAAKAKAKAEKEAERVRQQEIAKHGGVWEAMRARVALRQLEEKRLAEEAAEAKAEEARAKAARKSNLLGRFQQFEAQAADDAKKGLSDREVAERRMVREQRAAPKAFDPAVAASVPKAAVFDPQEAFMVTSRHLATMARPTGRAKKFFESWQEERAEASRDLVERANGRMLYAEVLTWTFPTAAAGQRLVDAAKMLVQDDAQAEAYFRVFRVPDDSTHTAGYMVGDFRYLTVAVGTCDQYRRLHEEYDLREILSEGRSTYGDRAGIKRLEGTFFCVDAPTELMKIIDSWNGDVTSGGGDGDNWCKIKVVRTPRLGVPGGWTTIAKHTKEQREEGDDLLITLGRIDAKTPAAADSAKNYETILRSEYAKLAPQISEFKIFHGWHSPLDLVEKEGGSSVLTLTMWSGSLLAAAMKNARISTRELSDGIAARGMLFMGPAATSPSVQAIVRDLDSAPLISAVVLPDAM